MIQGTITYSCGGCDAVHTTDLIPMRADRQPLHWPSWKAVRDAGMPGAICVTTKPKLDPEEHAPEGWVVFDPYTLCTYCPPCWLSIIEDVDGSPASDDVVSIGAPDDKE